MSPAFEEVPAAQLVHAPPETEVWPAAQFVQEASPAFEDVPAAQLVQAPPDTEVCPAAQFAQVVSPALEEVPAAQLSHALLAPFGIVPAVHCVQAD